MSLRIALPPLAALLAAGCATLPERPAAAPARPGFVIAANPLAVKAGMDVLQRGGSAADAAVAVQAMLSLVEPQSSGIGGGAFMTWFDGATGDCHLSQNFHYAVGAGGVMTSQTAPVASRTERITASLPPSSRGHVESSNSVHW